MHMQNTLMAGLSESLWRLDPEMRLSSSLKVLITCRVEGRRSSYGELTSLTVGLISTLLL